MELFFQMKNQYNRADIRTIRRERMFRIWRVLPLLPPNGCNERRTNIQIRYPWRFHRFWNLREENDDRELSRCYFGETLERRCFGRIRASQSHWGIDRSWYEQTCGQEKTNRNSRRNFRQTGNPRKEVSRSRDSSDNREDPRKGGVQGRGEAAQQKVRESSEAYRSPLPHPKRFTVGGSGEKDDLTGGLHTDGLHPNPEYLQRYSEDLYDALKPLF